MEYERMIIAEVRKIRSVNQAYGTRKLWRQLARDGIIIGRDRLHRILRKYDLLLPRHYKKVYTTFPGIYEPGFENKIKGLAVDHVNQAWCTDITYIHTTEGILYVSALMDLYSRKIISYNISNNLRTEGALGCLERALKEVTQTKGIIHHSDHGTQYCSYRYLHTLHRNGLEVSFTGKDHCFDNAKMERFFNTLKYEYGLQAVVRNKKLAIELIKKAINNYNHIRLHAAINYMTPSELYDAA
jgi:transposase InsO family protein